MSWVGNTDGLPCLEILQGRKKSLMLNHPFSPHTQRSPLATSYREQHLGFSRDPRLSPRTQQSPSSVSLSVAQPWASAIPSYNEHLLHCLLIPRAATSLLIPIADPPPSPHTQARPLASSCYMEHLLPSTLTYSGPWVSSSELTVKSSRVGYTHSSLSTCQKTLVRIYTSESL